MALLPAVRSWWWARQRAIDLRVLWPECKRIAPTIEHARAGFAHHAFNDPAWREHYGERGLQEFISRLD